MAQEARVNGPPAVIVATWAHPRLLAEQLPDRWKPAKSPAEAGRKA
jgi:hypothetical protein